MNNDTIVAISTATGGALSIVRLSGGNSLKIIQTLFSKHIKEPRKAYYGQLNDNGVLIDEVVVVWYQCKASFTGEDSVEISCHGSRWISNEIVRVCIKCGARVATAGEFTQRAFLNGKMDLSQAEAIGDLIAAQSKSAAQVALSQMRGGYSKKLSEMRTKLLNIKSLLELELDFGEEDVEFASRGDLVTLLNDLKERCHKLATSFSLGNVLKNGVPVAIVGKPNVGKSTLLNALVGDERAIVSDIAGTTRDYIEEIVNIDGVDFRFVDTAGIGQTDDKIEAIGVQRSFERMKVAKIILQLIDSDQFEPIQTSTDQTLLIINNKSDIFTSSSSDLAISAKFKHGLDQLKAKLVELSGARNFDNEMVIVSNLRHYQALLGANSAIEESLQGIENGLSGDLLAASLSDALNHLGAITGEFTTDEVLANIFQNFCIGK